MKDKVVIITGASSGIGLACAWEFAKKGYCVVLAARSANLIDRAAGEMKERGLEAFPVKTDVSEEKDCKNLIDSTVKKYGRIDVLINNAGISMRALFNDADLLVLKKVMDINFWGTVYCTKYALPYLLDSGGSVTGVSSIAGYHGLPGRTGYSASKFAIHGFLEALRIETLYRGLHVLIAAPGFTSSNIRKTALAADGTVQGESPRAEERMMPAREVAKHIYRSIVKRKRSLILTRQGKTTVMLKKIAPGLLDRMVYKHLAEEPDSPFKN